MKKKKNLKRETLTWCGVPVCVFQSSWSVWKRAWTRSMMTWSRLRETWLTCPSAAASVFAPVTGTLNTKPQWRLHITVVFFLFGFFGCTAQKKFIMFTLLFYVLLACIFYYLWNRYVARFLRKIHDLNFTMIAVNRHARSCVKLL